MKITLLTCMLLVGLASCQLTDQQGGDGVSTNDIHNPNSGFDPNADPADLPRFSFTETEYDFGTISQGEKAAFSYTFTNVGKLPLVIQSVNVGCGCTVIDDWPKEPIEPGQGGEIKVEFNSDGKKGNISKSVTIVANTSPSTSVVKLKGVVLAPDNN